MTSKTPPVPPANRSDKGPGGRKHGSVGKAVDMKPGDPDKQGQQANTKINTTNQGLQQDR